MTPNNYFAKSKGAFPENGVVGKESAWMEVGLITVPFGQLWTGDLQALDAEDGVAMQVPLGQYRVQVKGVDFKGHRRTARVRAFLDSSADVASGEQIGEVGIDTGTLAIYDMAAFKSHVGKQHAKQFWPHMAQAAMNDIVGCMSREYSGKQFDVAFLPSGLGDGCFKVFVLRAQTRTVGLEVELLAPGFSANFSRM